MPSRSRPSSFVHSVVLAALLGVSFASPASADATVIVELKAKDGAATDGVVELSKGESKHSCSTHAGRCEIKGVAGGMYTVEVKIEGKPSPKPKQVMIPPDGEAKLVVHAS